MDVFTTVDHDLVGEAHLLYSDTCKRQAVSVHIAHHSAPPPCTHPLGITQIPLERWDVDRLTRTAPPGAPMPARFGGWVAGADVFDAALFGISGAEAMLMDAQQRLVLEVAHEALALAGRWVALGGGLGK